MDFKSSKEPIIHLEKSMERKNSSILFNPFIQDLDSLLFYWLGLDSYRKILYGFKYHEDNENCRPIFEFAKLDIFTGKFVSFETVAFDELINKRLSSYSTNTVGLDYLTVHWRHTGPTISNDGRLVGILFRAEYCEVHHIFVFCSLELETGKIYCYVLQESDHFNDKLYYGFLDLRCSCENQWILINYTTRFYHLLLDDNLEMCYLNPLTESN